MSDGGVDDTDRKAVVPEKEEDVAQDIGKTPFGPKREVINESEEVDQAEESEDDSRRYDLDDTRNVATIGSETQQR